MKKTLFLLHGRVVQCMTFLHMSMFDLDDEEHDRVLCPEKNSTSLEVVLFVLQDQQLRRAG